MILPEIFTQVILLSSLFVPLSDHNANMDKMPESQSEEYQLVKELLDNTTPDYTVSRGSKCSLHSLEMNKTEVDIVYGLRNESERREMGIDYKSFPNGRDYISGGCVVWSGMDVKAIIYLCASCVEVRNKWLEKNSMEQIWDDRVRKMILSDPSLRRIDLNP